MTHYSIKFSEFRTQVDNPQLVIDYNLEIMGAETAMERIAMEDDSQYIQVHRGYHQVSLENAKCIFAKLTVKDIAYMAEKRIYEGDADGGSRFVIISEKR